MNNPTAVDTNSRLLIAHNEATNRYVFSGNLVLRRALHIGSGRGNDETDALVVVDGDSRPLIPGSSLRGALRARTERLLAGLYETKASSLWACGLYEAETPGDKICVGNSNHEPSKSAYETLSKEDDLETIWKELDGKLCDACRLFGAGTFWATKIRFTDLMLESGGQTKIRHGVGIHRDTGTAAPKIKYDRQVVESGAVFSFEAVGENLDPVDKAILALAFSQLTGGELALGGGTGRGLGSVELEGGRVTWVNMNQRDDLIAYLLHKKNSGEQSLETFIANNLDGIISPVEQGGDHA